MSGFLTLLCVASKKLSCLLPCSSAAELRQTVPAPHIVLSRVLAIACVAQQVERLLADLEAELARRYPQAVN